VLRHRIFTNFNADAEGVAVDRVFEKTLQTVPAPAPPVAAPSGPPAAPVPSYPHLVIPMPPPK